MSVFKENDSVIIKIFDQDLFLNSFDTNVLVPDDSSKDVVVEIKNVIYLYGTQDESLECFLNCQFTLEKAFVRDFTPSTELNTQVQFDQDTYYFKNKDNLYLNYNKFTSYLFLSKDKIGIHITYNKDGSVTLNPIDVKYTPVYPSSPIHMDYIELISNKIILENGAFEKNIPIVKNSLEKTEQKFQVLILSDDKKSVREPNISDTLQNYEVPLDGIPEGKKFFMYTNDKKVLSYKDGVYKITDEVNQYNCNDCVFNFKRVEGSMDRYKIKQNDTELKEIIQTPLKELTTEYLVKFYIEDGLKKAFVHKNGDVTMGFLGSTEFNIAEYKDNLKPETFKNVKKEQKPEYLLKFLFFLLVCLVCFLIYFYFAE